MGRGAGRFTKLFPCWIGGNSPIGASGTIVEGVSLEEGG